MRLGNVLTVIGLAVGASGALVFQGCSSSTTAPSGGSAASPPTPPSAAKTTSTTEHNFAIKTLLLGDATRGGQTSINAWKDFGYDLDGKTSTKESTDVCTPPGNNPSAKEDGTNGIDNAFGNQILKFLLGISSDAATSVNQSLTDGEFTIMLDVTGLTDDATQTNTGLSGILLPGDTFDPDGGAKPTFTTSDNWPVNPDLLTDTKNPRSSKVQFANAFVTNGLFVNGAQSDVHVSLTIQGEKIDLTVHRAILSFQHNGSSAENGTIAGILDTNELVTNIKGIAGRILPALCSGDTLNHLVDTIQSSSDIMNDGSQDPNATCNGISIGLGFTAAEIGLPSKVAPEVAPDPDPCTAGGGDDAGTD